MIAQDPTTFGAALPTVAKPNLVTQPIAPAQPAMPKVQPIADTGTAAAPTATPAPTAAPTSAPTATPTTAATAALPALPTTVPLPNDAGNGNTFVNSTTPPVPNATPATGASATQLPSPVLGTAPATSLAPGVNTTPIDPTDDLASQLITPGPGTNRFDIAKQQLDTYNQATDPMYQAAQREAVANGAALGQLGGGQLRTSVGNLADARQNELETQGQTFLQDALDGSIQDAYNNIGIAQQQQAYQSAAQNQTFDQGVTGATTQQALTTSAIDNALNELAAGDAASPADVQMLLSQLFSGNATSAGNALSGLTSGTVNNSAQTAATNALMQYIQSLQIPAKPAGATS